jgi:hypothetical protein
LSKKMPFVDNFSPFPSLPSVFLNLTTSQSPSIQRLNISGFVEGAFYESGVAARLPPCSTLPLWGDLVGRRHAAVRLASCWFNSLAKVMHDQGMFEGKLVKSLLGLDVDIYISSQPLDFVAFRDSSSLNATVKIEVVSGECDRASFVFQCILPVNLTVTRNGTVLSALVPNIRLEDLNATFTVENYHLPISANDLEPLLLVILQEDMLSVFNKVLAAGVDLPFKVADAFVSIGLGFVEIAGSKFL